MTPAADGTATRWRHASSLLNDVLERSTASRASWLAAAGASDARLARDVAELLQALDAGPLREAPSPPDESHPAHEEWVGPYRLLGLLGEGGMGTVHLAERHLHGARQRVALKLLRAGWTDPRLVERILEEQRILARLEHPGIARLIDAGTTPTGQPYLAMEYVRGVTLTQYCASANPSLEQRLALFLDVCDAVQFAHQELVVHRDLKPANVLVGADGRARLLDFGIAKLLEGDDDAMRQTRTHAWLTPAYASPEQVRGGHVSVRSDVYALGVILYELLAGVRPYELAGKGPAEVERLVCDVDPPRPSERAADPRRARALRGDLDVIALMAMAKDPTRRYATVAALAEDVRRHLDGRTVMARPDEALYRAGKWVRRHRAFAAAACFAVVCLAGGLVTTTWQARRATALAARAADEADRAARVSGLLVGLFRLSDPSETRGHTVTARELLDVGAARVERELADRPDVQGALLAELSRIYEGLGLLPRAESLAARAVAVQEARGGVATEDGVRALLALARVQVARGQGTVAITTYGHAIDAHARSGGVRDTILAQLLTGLAWELRAAHREAEAAPRFDEALAIWEATRGPDAIETAQAALGLAATHHDPRRFAKADSLFSRALARLDTSAAIVGPHAVSAMQALAVSHRLRGRYVEAERLMRVVQRARAAVLPPAHPLRLESEVELALARLDLGEPVAALALLEPAMPLAVASLGAGHPEAVSAREGRAAALVAAGRAVEALPQWDSVLALKRARVGSMHPEVAFSLVRSGEALVEAGRPAAARRRLAEAAAVAERVAGRRSVYRMLAVQRLAMLDLAAGRLADAERQLTEAWDVARATLRPGHRYLQALRRDRARLAMARGDASSALGELLAVAREEASILPPAHPRLASTLQRVAEAQLALGRPADAARSARAALAHLATIPRTHRMVGEVERLLGVAVAAQEGVRGRTVAAAVRRAE